MTKPEAMYLTIDDLSKMSDDTRKCKLSDFALYFSSNDVLNSYFVHNKNMAAYYACDLKNVDRIDKNDIYSKLAFPRPVLQFNLLNWNREWNDKDEIELGFFPQNERIINEDDVEYYNFKYSKRNTTAASVVLTISDMADYNYGTDYRRYSYYCEMLAYYSLYIDKNNGKKYISNDCHTAYEIEPIKWIVDKKNKRLICKDLILPYCKYKQGLTSISDLISEIYDNRLEVFLKKYNKKEEKEKKEEAKIQKMLNKYTEKEEENKQNEEISDNGKTSNFKKIMNEIDSLLEYYYGDFDILGYVNKLVSDYNKKIKELNEKDESPILSLDETDRSKLYATLMFDLEQIVDKLKKNIEYFKDYREMLDIIHNCQKNPEEMDKEKDDISKDFYLIKSCLLPFLQDKNVDARLNSLLNDEEVYLVDIFKKANLFDSKEVIDLLPLSELKRQFAIKMNPFYIDLDRMINEKNIIDEIKKSYSEIGEKKYKIEKKSFITFYLENLNQLFSEILKIGNEKEINDAKLIVEKQVDLEKSFNAIIDDLNEKIKKLNKIILNIQKRKSNDDDLINIDSKSKTY